MAWVGPRCLKRRDVQNYFNESHIMWQFEFCNLQTNQIPEHIVDVAVAALHDNQLLLIQIQLNKDMAINFFTLQLHQWPHQGSLLFS